MAARWSYQAGEYGNTVTVYVPCSSSRKETNIYVRIRQKQTGKQLRRSLGHSNRQKAMTYADQTAKQLLTGAQMEAPEALTWGRLFSQYQRYETPKKEKGSQQHDRRRIEMWTRLLGGQRNPSDLTLRDLDAFIADRSSGRVDSRGQRAAGSLKTVRPRTVQADLQFLNTVLNWGARWHEGGKYLLHENPMRRFRIPPVKNPRRPVATHDRLLALMEVAPELRMRVAWTGKREHRPTYLPVLLDLADGTGRRIGAVCKLHSRDIRTDVGEHGAIVWRADSDKTGIERTILMTAHLRTIVDQCLDRVGGEGFLFPAPSDWSRPMGTYLAAKWLRDAEKLAGLQTQDGSGFHAYRRKFVTERKHHPAKDVSDAAGWKNPRIMMEMYQQADEATQLRALSEPLRLTSSNGEQRPRK